MTQSTQSIGGKIVDILFSTKLLLILFLLLGIGAAVATFIENDYGTSTARVLVYNNLWYEIVMSLSIINLLVIIYRRKMWKQKAKFIFHIAFVVILIGAGLTRYVGYEGIMHIHEGQTQNEMVSLEPYFQVTVDYDGKTYHNEWKKEFSAIGDNSFNYNMKFANKILTLSMDSYKFAKKGSATMNLIGTKITVDDEEKIEKLVGQRGSPGLVKNFKYKDDVMVSLTYGSKPLKLPFTIKLNDFQLDRYPGSMAPSSYASEVTVIDKANNVEFDYRIFMNSTLKYGGFQFFQSSYDPDEKGTVLSVNNDPGTIPTYIGYFLLTLGLLLNFFDKKSRFVKLVKYTKQFHSVALTIGLFALLNTPMFADENLKYLQDYKNNSKELATQFSKIVVQANMGRMKPLDTLNHEILNKLSRKSTFMGMDANQVALGMLTRPDIWQNVKMLKIRTPKLKQFLHIPKETKYVAFTEMFTKDGEYKLGKLVNDANRMNPNKRGTFEKDIIKLDERLNIAYMTYYGNLLKIFPQPKTTKWYEPMEAIKSLDKTASDMIKMMVGGFINNTADGKYDEASKYLDLISKFQVTIGKNIIPSKDIVNSEILFNKFDIFFKLTLAYMIVGLLMFIVSFLPVFNKNWYSNKLNTTFFVILATLFLLHTIGMGQRWYISGHAPWSNTYESLVYIAWSTMFAGVIFFRKSLMALSATVIMAGIFMFTAHLTGIDPQITNLVPVLKSYWLTIHVSIITGSYGFLALGAMLGFMSLILFTFRNPNKPHIDDSIRHITAINEAALIIGLSALVIGNFIGGVWANESWGRYWGWDPKETWAYISIVFYALVLHLRMMPKLNTPYIFSVASTVVFASILMTYFGVNFYLSGMHSYATGDPVPVPTWAYVTTFIVFLVILISSRKRDLPKLKI